MKKVFIIAGETSGDLHAANLTRALLELAPPGELELVGMGGRRMAEAGVRIVQPIAGLEVMGFVEVLRKLGKFRQVERSLLERFRAEKPDVLVLVDYPGFNLHFTARARKAGFGGLIHYYIAPQVWAWHRGRVRTLARLVDRMLVIFPFEVPIYEAAGVPVTFVGHPLLDILPAPGDPPPSLREELNLGDGEMLVALLPGSRRQVLGRHLPVFLGAADRLSKAFPGLRFAMALPGETHLEESERSAIERVCVRLERCEGASAELFRACDLALVSSGTATLEAAILGCPMVVAYRGSLLSYIIARTVVTLPCVSLANIVAGRPVVPELIQGKATPDRLAYEALRLLASPETLARMRRNLSAVRGKLGGPGASRRAAGEILSAVGVRQEADVGEK